MEAGGKRYITYPSKSNEFRIWAVGDLHLMTKACDLKRLRKDIRTIRDDPYSFWVGLGDYAEWIGKKDTKRFRAANVEAGIEVQDLGDLGQVTKERILKELAPIADKCMGLLYGNHETAYQVCMEQTGLHNRLCHALDGTPETKEKSRLDLGYCCLFDIVFVHTPKGKVELLWDNPPLAGTRRQWRIFAHHGAGGAQTAGGRINRLERFMRDFEADIYFTAHVHNETVIQPNYIAADEACTHLIEKTVLGIVTGSYYKTYCEGVTTYGEQRAYRPAKLGAASVLIKPYHQIIRAV